MTEAEKRAYIRDNFMKWSEELTRTFHEWYVLMPLGDGRFRHETFKAEEFETAEDEYEAVCDLVRGCLACGQEYSVFCDDKLVMGF